MASPAVTYTFSNSTTADATQVNQNYTDLINGATDGTKDYSINALTVAGTATLNGDVNIGNASADTLTITAALGSSIPIKTTNTYDIGSSTLGLRAAYFGANSQTVKLLASSSLAATWSLTLPVNVPGIAGQALCSTTGGVSSWASKTLTNDSVQTGTYAVLTTDDTVRVTNAGATWNATLPASTGNQGKRIIIKKTDQTTNVVAINTTGGDTVEGRASGNVKLNRWGDFVEVSADGSANWVILGKKETEISTTFSSLKSLTGIPNQAFCAMTSGSLTLGIGQWRVTCAFWIYANTPAITALSPESGMYAANGTDLNATPTLLTGYSGWSTFNEQTAQNPLTNLPINTAMTPATLVMIITLSASTTIYGVPRVNGPNTGSGVAVGLLAERIW